MASGGGKQPNLTKASASAKHNRRAQVAQMTQKDEAGIRQEEGSGVRLGEVRHRPKSKQAGEKDEGSSAHARKKTQARRHAQAGAAFRRRGDGRGREAGVAAVTATALSARQSQQHAVWRKVIEDAQDVSAALEVLEAERCARNWKWSSTRTHLGAFYGALRRSSKWHSWKDSPVLRDYTRAVDRKTVAEEVDYPTPLAESHALRAISELARENRQCAMFLLLQWATTARPHCVSLLQARNVTLRSKNCVAVTFCRGKGAWSRAAPYTVHTTMGPFFNMLVDFLRGNNDLFPNAGRSYDKLKEVLRLKLRAIDPAYRLGSVRRGALEAIAAGGADEATLMSFSGHRNGKTLRRYLRWGATFQHEANNMTSAASNLWM